MTKELFKLMLQEVNSKVREYETTEKRKLLINYVRELPYEIGDTVEDIVGRKVRIVKLGRLQIRDCEPLVSFVCDNLNKNGEINKREPVVEVFLSNIVDNH